ncbi:E3 ubiquitin-protein ligase UPL5 isoform X2 [Physcomitrium patens]|uniref:E3 ubiquitin-protein ligase UPL5 isoform X2 n=1 Tax=Physcomitrium patens TaxID=3218 RepID=UPI000D151D27|nr:E3 ubiquitin-protein ligase UPL5-like isoform X2 [Physcomitrium patens]|eukprot:XP_024400554.1 E3 ubiquitin-protein ligase UPL5-like isoform X2 [Physcomitrella patens]
MVLSVLALSIWGLFRCMRQITSVQSSRVHNRPSTASSSLNMEVISLREDDRVERTQREIHAALLHNPVMAERSHTVRERELTLERGLEIQDREAHFMSSARAQALVSPVGLRSTSSKRKLDDYEIGVAESSVSATSQVRARRETREDVQEGSVTESSGRERFEIGLLVGAAEAQPLDGESQMREEDGNAALDDDSTWEDEPNWNLSSSEEIGESSKEPPDKIEDSSRAEEDRRLEEVSEDHGSTLQVVLGGPTMVVDSGSNPYEFTLTSDPTNRSSTGVSLSSLGVNDVGRVEVEAGHSGSNEGRTDDLASSDVQIEGETADDEFSAKELERDGIIDCQEELISGNHRNSSTLMTRPGDFIASSISSISNLTVGTSAGRMNDERLVRIDGCSSSPMELSPARLQFFVRTYGRTIVLHAHASDLVESVHQQIFAKTGLPVSEQRLIFGRLQLQHDQTLESCQFYNDATLTLVARMRSTALPASWQLINDLVATIRHMCDVGDQQLGLKLMHSQDCVRASVQEFLKMAVKSVPVSEHMQVFELAGATSALVMLLLSPVESNRECAEDAITLFLSSNDEYLPASIHRHCAPVLLDFCKLLNKSAPNHNLYASCRQTLARLLETVGVAHGSPYFNEAKAEKIVEDFAPFVNELSARLTQNLRCTAKAYASKESPVSFSSYVKEAKDFTAFVIPLCKAIEVCKGIDTSGSGSIAKESAVVLAECPCNTDNAVVSEGLLSAYDFTRNIAAEVGAEIGSHGWLRQLFKDLLLEVDSCLEAVGLVAERQNESYGPDSIVSEDRPFGLAPFLVVLKGLHAIAKLYEGAMADLMEMLLVRRVSLNILIRQSRWQDEDFWLLEHKSLLDFESKRRLVMAMLPEPQDDHDERQEVVVKRATLLTESFEQLAYVEPEVLQGGISVEFATEEATGPGVLREWFSMICREIFNPQNALFLACPNDRRRFFPNPASGVNPGHLTYFRFCGRVIALALMHRVQMDVVFALSFFKQLAGLPVLWEDAKDADPTLYESCKKILELDADLIDTDILGLTFVSEVEELGSHKSMELCLGGKDMVVTSENRRHFVELLVQRRLVSSVAEQVKSFSQGFSDLLLNSTTHQQFIRALTPEDLDLMLYGKDRNICLEDWKAHTEYHDYSATDDYIIWFWQIVEKMAPDQRRRLLFFSTSVVHLPAEGFAGLSSKFHIHRAHTDISWLPTAHTCFYQLVLPAYPTYEIMCARLLAITERHVAEGFGFA